MVSKVKGHGINGQWSLGPEFKGQGSQSRRSKVGVMGQRVGGHGRSKGERSWEQSSKVTVLKDQGSWVKCQGVKGHWVQKLKVKGHRSMVVGRRSRVMESEVRKWGGQRSWSQRSKVAGFKVKGCGVQGQM